MLVGKAVGLGARVVVEITGGHHAFQPFLDVAVFEPRLLRERSRGERAFALHRAPQAGFHAEVNHTRAHGAGHVTEHLVERLLCLLFVYSHSPFGMGKPA